MVYFLNRSQLEQRRQKRAKEREHERKCKIDKLQDTGELTNAEMIDAQERANVAAEIQRILARRKYGSSVYNRSFEVMRRKLKHPGHDGEWRLRRYVVEMIQRKHSENVVCSLMFSIFVNVFIIYLFYFLMFTAFAYSKNILFGTLKKKKKNGI